MRTSSQRKSQVSLLCHLFTQFLIKIKVFLQHQLTIPSYLHTKLSLSSYHIIPFQFMIPNHPIIVFHFKVKTSLQYPLMSLFHLTIVFLIKIKVLFPMSSFHFKIKTSSFTPFIIQLNIKT